MCFTLTFPTNPVFAPCAGLAGDPFSIPAAVRRRCATGGDRVEKVKVRSGDMVIIVGTGTEGWKCAVRALL